MKVPPLPRTPGGARRLFDVYTQGVNAGQNPPLPCRAAGGYERLSEGGVALGMFGRAEYRTGRVTLALGDVLVMYSDGMTEAEDPDGRPFDEAGLQRVVDIAANGSAKELGWAAFQAVEQHSRERRLYDDLTVLVARRLPPLPAIPMAERAAVGI